MHALDYFCKINKISLTELSNYLGIARTTPTSWKNGSKNFPDKYKLEIAKLFQIPVDKIYLLDMEEIGEIERAEIELIFNRACLDNAKEQGSELIMPSLRMNIQMLERHIEMYKVIYKLKSKLIKSIANINQYEYERKLGEVKSMIDKL